MKKCILILAILFLLTGCFKNETKDKESIIENTEEIIESKNVNYKIYKEHCLDDICILITDITCTEGFCGLLLDVENNSNIKTENIVKLTFDNSDNDILVYYDFNAIEGNVYSTEIQLLDDTYLNSSDYILEYASEEEKNSVIIK